MTTGNDSHTGPPDLTLHDTLDIISDGVWDWNASSGHVYRSPTWYRMLGFPEGALDNTLLSWENLIHPEDHARVMAHFHAYIGGRGDHYRIEYRCRRRDGGFHWIEDRGKALQRNADGSVARMVGVHRDIHQQKLAQLALEQRNRELNALVEERTRELREANAALEKKVDEAQAMAERDRLTGIANRYRLENMLRLEHARAARYGNPLSLIILDIDHFKSINDHYGHTIGDLVLIAVAQLVQNNIRASDLVARWGGEEFAVVAPDSPLSAAAALAEKLRAVLASTSLLDDIRVTGSFGTAQLDAAEDLESLVRRADQALYRAKASGRNRVELS